MKVEIDVPDGKRAEWVDGVLTLVDETPKDIAEKIKSFEDAYEWCRENDKSTLTYEYDVITHQREKVAPALSADIIAYLKLRIIVAALNEGWEPKFEKGEWRWYPWFNLHTKDEYDLLCDEEKSRVVLRSGDNSFADSGLAYANADNACSFSSTSCGARLAFRNERLTEYAGTQFAALYADLCFKPE